MLPIVFEGAYSFLQNDYFSDSSSMPHPISNDGYDAAIDKIWDSASWRKSVFGVKTIARYNVHAFFFQLLATGILTFEWTNAMTGVGLVLVLDKDNAGKFIYHTLANWYGFNFRSKRWGGTPITFTLLKDIG